MFPDRGRAIVEGAFCDAFPFMSYEQQCEYTEYLKVRFTSDEYDGTEGFDGHFEVKTEGKC